MSEDLFLKIIDKEIPADIVYEDDDVLAFNDINAQAPLHVLIIPKKHIKDVASLDDQSVQSAGKILQMAHKLSKTLNGSQSFRLVMNNGADAGQSVFHLHCHFISGKHLSDF